ncbi:arginine-tRNA-protein transferase, partial [Schizophyllum fasciatum]
MTTSVGYAVGSSATTCGYCSPPGERTHHESSYHTAGLEAIQLSCPVYQDMIDRGWRRSGQLDAQAFVPSKSHRKVLRRWNNHILHGKSGNAMDVDSTQSRIDSKGIAKRQHQFTLVSAVHESESGFHGVEHPAHIFETTLEPASYSDEKYSLYEKYQREIHHDELNTPRGFKRFLVASPLRPSPIPYLSPPAEHLPRTYGSYHQLYRVDGKLIAMAVLDILPKCVSSVYFMYDNDWQAFSLGKLSAMREAALAKEMNDAGAKELAYLYMGKSCFYIHSCQKMRYKGEYS